MKNKLRLTAILVAVAMLSVTVFTGCGGSGSSGKKDTEEPGAGLPEALFSPTIVSVSCREPDFPLPNPPP